MHVSVTPAQGSSVLEQAPVCRSKCGVSMELRMLCCACSLKPGNLMLASKVDLGNASAPPPTLKVCDWGTGEILDSLSLPVPTNERYQL